jgi:pimeloyl-ACP methyl ester carboxylesterase/SAM-dependent methyltransferase
VGDGRLVRVNGVDLCVQTFGEPPDPAILLIAGSGASMDWWEDGLCERLAAGSRFVIRYDHRDTGQSIGYPPGAPEYTFDDLVADAVGVLDAIEAGFAGSDVDEAPGHLVGISMGGSIGQLLALDRPERVASLTLISSSPGPGDPDLPAMSAELRSFFAGLAATPDWSDRAAAIDYLVESQRRFAARSLPFDPAAMRELAARVVDRTRDIGASMINHHLIEGAARWRPRLGAVTAPTLVIHGTEDPLFRYEHAVALALEIPGADLLPLEQTGHELPRRAWDVVVPAILRHTSGGWNAQASRLAAEAIDRNDPTAWFERLYAAADSGAVAMPWDRSDPLRLLVEWAAERGLGGAGRCALVVGCGLGKDSEYIGGLGFETTAFDISETAIRLVRDRYPDSPVEYVTADLLDPPARWRDAFDLVVESHTVQALPDPPRRQAIANVAGMVAPGGTLIVIAAARAEASAPAQGPPWPLTRAEIGAFAVNGLETVRVEDLPDPADPRIRRWRAEFHHP